MTLNRKLAAASTAAAANPATDAGATARDCPKNSLQIEVASGLAKIGNRFGRFAANRDLAAAIQLAGANDNVLAWACRYKHILGRNARSQRKCLAILLGLEQKRQVGGLGMGLRRARVASAGLPHRYPAERQETADPARNCTELH